MPKQKLILWLLFSALIWLSGCVGSKLTGGSVPIGNPRPGQLDGRVTLVGTVVGEDDLRVPLADTEVEIAFEEEDDAKEEDDTKLVVKTDASGMFFVQLLRDKRYTLKVRPPSGLKLIYQERVGDFVTDANEIRLLIPVPRKGMVMPVFNELRIQPQEVTLRVRERVQFRIQLEPSPQEPIHPIWSVHCGIGVITPDGLFIATRIGQGAVRARVGHLHAQALVKVISD